MAFFDLLKDIAQRAKREVDILPSALKYFPGELKKTIGKVGEFVPGRELAKGLGYTLALPKVERIQEETARKQREFQDTLLNEFRRARAEGNEEKAARIRKVIEQFKFTDVLGEVMAEAPTARQVVASSAELALLATMGYKPYLPTGKLVGGRTVAEAGRFYKAIKAATQAEKLRKAGLPTKILIKGVKPIAKEAAIGAGFFGTMKATERDATIKDIVKAAETGALVSGGITGVMMGIGKGLQLGTKYLGPPISRRWQKAMMALERTAAAEAPLRKEGKSKLQKVLSYIGETAKLKTKAARVALKGIQEVRKLKMRFVDRFAPGARIEQRIAEITGRPLKESEKIYRDMRLLTSVSDAQAEKMVLDLMDDLAKYKGVEDKAVAWMAQLDFIDRARLGQKVPGNQSLDDLLRGLKKLAAEIGPDDMKKVAEVRRIIQRHTTKLLQMRVDAGLISKETMNILLKTHPNYIPHNVIMTIDEKVVQGLSQSLNVPKTDLMKAVGSAKNIENPIAATIQRTQVATRVIEKNKLLNNFVKAQEKYNLFPGMKRLIPEKTKVLTRMRLKSGEIKLVKRTVEKLPKISPGFDTINLFRNGIKETWVVPEDIAIAIKNLDAPLTPGWWKFLTTPQRILKKGATQYNLSFALPNKFRDKQTAALTAEAFIEEIAKKTGVSPKVVNLSKKELLELYKISGGYGSSIWREGESTILKDLQKKGITKVISSANPAKIIDTANEMIETSTRLEVFKKALARGLSPKDAAFVAREATIDFAKMGTWMRPLNQAIPFLNARVQGFINLPRAFIASPETFTRMQLYTAVYPTIALYQHNRRYESYKNISQYFKNRYWIIMISETDGIDSYTGQPIKVPQFITIPKGEGQQLVSGPIQYYLEKSDGIDYRKTSEMIADVLGSASPMEFQSFDQANWLTTAISQFGPVATIATGRGFGIHPYFGTPIVPESRKKAPKEMQFKKTTPEITKKIANIIGVEPAYLEFYINTFGGLPQDLQKSADIVYNVVREGKIGGHPISETPIGAVTQIPLARRFVREAREYYGPVMEYRKKQKEKIETELIGEKLKIKDKAEEIYIEMMKRKTKEERLNYLNSLGDELTPEIKKKILQIKRYRQAVEVLKPTDSVELRARYILMRIDEMKQQGCSKEEIVEWLNKVEKAKILTQKVRDKIWELKNQ